MNDVGVVAIGRNEGDRLRLCLESVASLGLPVVYVDSGSTDASIATARSMGVEVVELDMSRPFSAARARNEGFERLGIVAPGLRYVQFVDGDCQVVEGWIARARAELEARPKAAVVCGRRREKYPEHSIYNRLVDLEWETPVGEATACGGDAMMRVEAFEAVNGFEPSAIAGEEPELCQRLRHEGWSVWRIDAEMTRHDLDMTRFWQWWRRMVRCGYNGLDIKTRFPGDDRPFEDELFRGRLWGVGWPVGIVLGGVCGWMIGGPGVGLATAGLVALTIPMQVFRLAWKVRRKVDRFSTALAQGTFLTIGKWANLTGQVGYLRDRWRGRSGRLIEYKRVEAVDVS